MAVRVVGLCTSARRAKAVSCGYFLPRILTKILSRPVHWTSSSTIFVAHASEPRVICLQYPSNRQFSLPNPPSLTTNPASHEPPTIISGSARDSWLFAYLPGIDTEAVGCLWRKGSTVDSWMVKEWWTFARGAGVVTARWLNPEREVSAVTSRFSKPWRQ